MAVKEPAKHSDIKKESNRKVSQIESLVKKIKSMEQQCTNTYECA